MKDKTMGNQQERLSDFEIGWLAGVFDGEGYVGLSVNTTNRSIYPACKVTSTHLAFIQEVERLTKIIGIEYSFYERNPKQKNHSTSWTVDIRTCKRVKILIDVLLPHLILKKPHAEVILEFCNSRLSLRYGHPYTERELFLFKEIHKYNYQKGPKRIHNDYTPSKHPRYRLKI